MVSLKEVQASNARIASSLPVGLIAVFVGATSGIGEYTLKAFIKYTNAPRVYFIGRSQEAGDRIVAECKILNSEAACTFIKADVSLIRTVDEVCQTIKNKEKTLNLLFLSPGTLTTKTKTSEGLHLAAALITYTRTRFTLNLLPLLQRASSLRRVVNILGSGKEGYIYENDLQAWDVPLFYVRGHAASVTTLTLETLSVRAPKVSFISNFPGAVQSNLARSGQGVAVAVINVLFRIIIPWICVPREECGERQLFLATSARYAAKVDEGADGVSVEGGMDVGRGADGKAGSGIYSLDQDCESVRLSPKVAELLGGYRRDGVVAKIWEDTEAQFMRITGTVVA